jgi:hypothetical protein
MDLPTSGGFSAAVFFGAVVIWFHAWNQFNRPSYTQTTDFTRVLQRLQPSDMRRSSVFIQAYVFYAVVLTFIYLLICIYASVPFLREVLPIEIAGLDLQAGAGELPEGAALATGAAFDDAPLGMVGDSGAGPSPTLPLLVSLAVVGLAPNVPFLARIEEWIRSRSHKLSGIPTHLVDSGLKLRRERLLDPGRGRGLLVSEEEWAQADHYYRAAGRVAKRERDTLREQVLKTIALRNWVLRGRVFYPDGATRAIYHALETEVRQEIRDLLAKLDALADRSMAAPEKENAEETAERGLEWSALVREAEEVCGNVCVLVALYSERDAFAADMKQVQATSVQPESEYDAERREAGAILQAALRRVSIVSDKDTFGTTVFFRLAGSIILCATVAGLLIGQERRTGGDQIQDIVLAFKYAVTYAIQYALPLFFALGFQQERLRQDRWENMVGRKKSRAITQYTVIFFIASLIALVGLIANNIYFAIADVGFEIVAERFDAVLLAAYQVEGPRAVMGGALACCVTLTIDAWRAGRLTRWDGRWPWALIAGTTAVLASLALWERLRAEWVWIQVVGGDFSLASLPLQRIGWDVFTAALIGFVASAYVVLSLIDENDDERVEA